MGEIDTGRSSFSLVHVDAGIVPIPDSHNNTGIVPIPESLVEIVTVHVHASMPEQDGGKPISEELELALYLSQR